MNDEDPLEANRRLWDARTPIHVRSDVYEAAVALGGETFDIVFTSYGVLAWLPDASKPA